MNVDLRFLATANFALQVLLVLTLLAAAYLGKKKIGLKAHCLMLRIAVLSLVASVAVVMLPSMIGYLGNEPSPWFFNGEIIVHGTLGLAVIVLALWINALMVRRPPRVMTAVKLMRVTFFLWLATFALGFHIGQTIWG